MIVESDIVGVKRIMEVCQETVKRTMPGKQCPRACERGSRTKGRGHFTSEAVCSLDCSWMLFNAYCVKILRLVYKIRLFLLDLRT